MSSFLAIPNPHAARRLFLGRSGLLLSGAAVALLAGRDVARRQGGRQHSRRRAHPQHRARRRARGDRRLPGRRRKRPAAKAGARPRGHSSRATTRSTPICSRRRCRSSAASRWRRRRKYTFPVETLKNQADVLRFAAKLEKGAVSAYLGAVPLFGNRDLAKAAASILGDEAMHWAILRNALGEKPVPPPSCPEHASPALLAGARSRSARAPRSGGGRGDAEARRGSSMRAASPATRSPTTASGRGTAACSAAAPAACRASTIRRR